ncbi:hypothetical protein scyTo_0000245 [Scyliorhinus torazame]|uniref:Uncharacterized protein n=1 Tax=Scyliorhinus torazame TaxID=75743 RepID=A0A401NTI3_SCYTO|nr:hypothetical protein [Scyliorhinus torazame]
MALCEVPLVMTTCAQSTILIQNHLALPEATSHPQQSSRDLQLRGGGGSKTDCWEVYGSTDGNNRNHDITGRILCWLTPKLGKVIGQRISSNAKITAGTFFACIHSCCFG